MIYKSFTWLATSTLLAFSGLAHTDFLTLPSAKTTTAEKRLTLEPKQVATPQRGDSQTQVLAQFGPPLKRHPTVSKNGPKSQPPITRWDYSNFTVVFENQSVISSVISQKKAN